MKTFLYILSAVILVIPLFYPIKRKGKNRLSYAGLAFVILVLLSIGINVFIDYEENQSNVKAESITLSLLGKTDSLKYLTAMLFDSIAIMQEKLNKRMALSDSIKIREGLNERPLIKITEANHLPDGNIELRIVNDSKIAALNMKGRYTFIAKSLYDNAVTKVTQKLLPLNSTDILTDKDVYMQIKIPAGIIDINKYINSNWIYLVVSISYQKDLQQKTYLYETVLRLRKLDNGKFLGCFETEYKHYIKYDRQ